MNLCISTMDPSFGGGVGTQSRLFREYLKKQKINFRFIYPVNLFENLFYKENNIYSGDIKIKCFNPILVLNYKLFSDFASKKIQSFDSFLGIGGQNFECLPFLKAKKTYSCWTATTFLEEWKTMKGNPILMAVNSLSVSTLLKLEKKIYEHSKNIFAVSSYTAELIKKRYNIDSKKIRVLPNPVDFSEFNPSGSNKIKPGFDYLLFAGDLIKRKGVNYLIRSFKEVIGIYPDLKLLIVGTGPERTRLYNLVKSLKLENNVIFLGRVKQELMPSYFRQAKVFVLPSLQEGFGIVLAEALACRTPVIATDCGGTKDIVEDNINGFLVPKQDPKTLAEKIIKLLNNNGLRKSMGDKGFRKVKKEFSLDLVGKRLLSNL